MAGRCLVVNRYLLIATYAVTLIQILHTSAIFTEVFLRFPQSRAGINIKQIAKLFRLTASFTLRPYYNHPLSLFFFKKEKLYI